LTHQTIHASFFQVEVLGGENFTFDMGFRLTSFDAFEDLPKARLTQKFFQRIENDLKSK
jgi:hypothetical protein